MKRWPIYQIEVRTGVLYCVSSVRMILGDIKRGEQEERHDRDERRINYMFCLHRLERWIGRVEGGGGG